MHSGTCCLLIIVKWSGEFDPGSKLPRPPHDVQKTVGRGLIVLDEFDCFSQLFHPRTEVL